MYMVFGDPIVSGCRLARAVRGLPLSERVFENLLSSAVHAGIPWVSSMPVADVILLKAFQLLKKPGEYTTRQERCSMP